MADTPDADREEGVAPQLLPTGRELGPGRCPAEQGEPRAPQQPVGAWAAAGAERGVLQRGGEDPLVEVERDGVRGGAEQRVHRRQLVRVAEVHHLQRPHHVLGRGAGWPWGGLWLGTPDSGLPVSNPRDSTRRSFVTRRDWRTFHKVISHTQLAHITVQRHITHSIFFIVADPWTWFSESLGTLWPSRRAEAQPSRQGGVPLHIDPQRAVAGVHRGRQRHRGGRRRAAAADGATGQWGHTATDAGGDAGGGVARAAQHELSKKGVRMVLPRAFFNGPRTRMPAQKLEILAGWKKSAG